MPIGASGSQTNPTPGRDRSSGNLFPIECHPLRHARHRSAEPRPARFAPLACGQRFAQRRAVLAQPVTGIRVLGLVSEPRIASRFALTSVALTNRGTSARGRSAVHHVRADASAPLEPPARRRTVGLGATAQAPIDLNRCDPRAQTSNAGSDPGRRRELPSRGRMSPTAPARWPTEKHEMSLEDSYHARNDARDRYPSHPPRSDPGHPWASLADDGRLAPWLEGGGGQRSDLPRSIGSVPLEIPFPNVSRPA